MLFYAAFYQKITNIKEVNELDQITAAFILFSI